MPAPPVSSVSFSPLFSHSSSFSTILSFAVPADSARVLTSSFFLPSFFASSAGAAAVSAGASADAVSPAAADVSSAPVSAVSPAVFGLRPRRLPVVPAFFFLPACLPSTAWFSLSDAFSSAAAAGASPVSAPPFSTMAAVGVSSAAAAEAAFESSVCSAAAAGCASASVPFSAAAFAASSRARASAASCSRRWARFKAFSSRILARSCSRSLIACFLFSIMASTSFSSSAMVLSST